MDGFITADKTVIVYKAMWHHCVGPSFATYERADAEECRQSKVIAHKMVEEKELVKRGFGKFKALPKHIQAVLRDAMVRELRYVYDGWEDWHRHGWAKDRGGFRTLATILTEDLLKHNGDVLWLISNYDRLIYDVGDERTSSPDEGEHLRVTEVRAAEGTASCIFVMTDCNQLRGMLYLWDGCTLTFLQRTSYDPRPPYLDLKKYLLSDEFSELVL